MVVFTAKKDLISTLLSRMVVNAVGVVSVVDDHLIRIAIHDLNDNPLVIRLVRVVVHGARERIS